MPDSSLGPDRPYRTAGPDGAAAPGGPASESGAAAADTLRLHASAPPRATVGRPLVVDLRVENVAGRALDLYLRGREPAVDLIVRDGGGRLVRRTLDHASIPAILRLETLAPGASLTLRVTWDGLIGGVAAAPGVYTLTAELLTETGRLRFPPVRVERVAARPGRS